MIHTKLLIRRLAYVPWLLAFGLVLGWAGEAQALIKDKAWTARREISVREDAGEQKITVKVTAPNKDEARAATSVTLVLRKDQDQLNKRFRINCPTLTIAAALMRQRGDHLHSYPMIKRGLRNRRRWWNASNSDDR